MSVQIDGWQFIVELTHLYRDVMQITEQATGMSQSRLQIMHELFHAEELTQAELQHHLGVEGAVITRIVKQLEAAGLVVRRADPRDNRFTLVALTPEARRISTVDTDTIKFKETIGAQIMEGLDEEERARLLDMMKRIQENVRAILKSE